MYITTIRTTNGKVTVTHHMHPSDVYALAILVRLCFAVCVIAALGLFIVVAIGRETTITNIGLTIGGVLLGLMAFKLRSVLGKVKQIPTSAPKPAMPQGKPNQQPNFGDRNRPIDNRNGQDFQQRPRCQACNSKFRDDGSCKNPNCVTHRQTILR